MTHWAAIPGWQLQWDNPDFRGWSVVAAYIVAAGFCARAALAPRKMGAEEKRVSAIWWLLAWGLLFLGINKQLSLQTLLIVLGRRAALAGGWYEQRRLAQMIFSAIFALAGLVALWFLLARFRQFFVRNPWAAIGLVVLVLFVLIRAASINHVIERAGLEQDEENDVKKWTWILEIGGSASLALAAIKARREHDIAHPG
jgi:multisubunit Na+/H+ antiporter MnhG subunit